MITLEDYMKCIGYRITEGSEYMWKCYGPDVYQLDSWNGKHSGDGSGTVNVVFDTKTQVVYEMQAWDDEGVYRWINPSYLEAVKAEYETRGLDFKHALDDIEFIDIEVENDMVEKSHAISNGLEYDKRIQVELTLDDDEIFRIMKMAHERDMTFNRFVETILEEAINQRQAPFV